MKVLDGDKAAVACWIGRRCIIGDGPGRLPRLWEDFWQTTPAHKLGKNRFSAYLQSLGHKRYVESNITWLADIRLKPKALRERLRAS